MTLALEATGPAARERWRSVLADGADAQVSQTPQWLDCIAAAAPYEDATHAYRGADGRLLVLPLARLRGSAGPLAIEGSMPFGWSFGGLLCAGEPTAAEVAAVAADLRRRGALRTTVRPAAATAAAWAAAVPAGVRRTARMEQTIDLDRGFDAVWRRLDSKVRSRQRKAAGRLVVEWDDAGRLVEVFDALYRCSVRRWAHQQHEPLPLARARAAWRDPRRKFVLVARRLGPSCRIGIAWRDGVPAAGIIVLAHGVHATYWRGAMDRDVAARTGANELLHVMAIEHACATGCRWYHMGESAPGSSLARFKRGFGADERHVEGYRFERLPLTAAEERLRAGVKRLIGFRD